MKEIPKDVIAQADQLRDARDVARHAHSLAHEKLEKFCRDSNIRQIGLSWITEYDYAKREPMPGGSYHTP